MKKYPTGLLPSLICSIATSFAPISHAGWYDDYTSVLTNPQNTDVAGVLPDVVRSAGYFGGWYGFWYLDEQKRTSYAPTTWAAMGNLGVKRMIYFDSGEVGDFSSFYNSSGSLVENAWSLRFWSGSPAIAEARWFGLDAFMKNPAWAPYPTANTYGLPAFTMPDGSAIPAGQLYSVLGKKGPDGVLTDKPITNAAVTDSTATASKLSTISQKIDGEWKTVHLYHIDNSNTQLLNHRIAEARFLMSDLRPDGIHIDNMGDNNLWWPRNSAFGDWSVHRFRGYLSNRFTSTQLAAMGIPDANAFDIRSHIQNGHAFDDPAWNDDKIWQEYKIFKATDGLDYQKQFYKAIKSHASSLGLDFAVTGNLLPVWPGAALSRGQFDIVNFEWRGEQPYPEWSWMGLPPNGRSSAYVARLGAKISKTPYCWINLYVETANANKPELHKVIACDTFANRAILDYSYDYDGKTHPGTDASAAFVNDWVEAMASHGFSDRAYLADIGVLFNPWVDVAETTVHSMQHDVFVEEYSGWCDYLVETQRQWDVIISEGMTLADLERFPIVVVPSVTTLTNGEVNLLKQYATNGGRLIITGETGTRNGRSASFLRRKTPAFQNFTAANFRSTANKPGLAYRKNNRASSAATEMNSLLSFSDLIPRVGINPTIPAGVNLSVHTVGGASVLTLDVNNYGNYRPADDTTFAAGATWVTIQLPPDLVAGPLRVRYLDMEMTDLSTLKSLPSSRVIHQPAQNRLLVQTYPTRYLQTIVIDKSPAN